MKRVVLLVSLSLVLLWPDFAGIARALGRPAGAQPELAVVQLIAVREGRGGRLIPRWSGSGAIISPNGLILTNCHVAMPREVWDDPQFSYDMLVLALASHPLAPPEPTYVVEVAQYDVELDIAVLRVSQTLDGRKVEPDTLNLPALPLGESERLAIDEEIRIWGYTGSGKPVMSVKSLVRDLPRGPGGRWIESPRSVEGGFSGGPVVNETGELVGIVARGPAESVEGIAHCRYTGDTNADGRVDLSDTCKATPPLIYTSRPVDLARSLITAAGYNVEPEPKATPKPRRRAPTPTPQPPPQRQEPSAGARPAFGPITFAEEADKAGYPVKPGTVFRYGITELHAFFTFQGMQVGIPWGWQWFLDDKPTKPIERTWDESKESGTYHITISLYDGTALPAGTWRLELILQDQVVQSATCVISENVPSEPARTPAPPVPSTPAPGAAEGVTIYGRITDGNTARGIRKAVFIVLQPGVLVRDVTSEADIYTMAEADNNGNYRLPKPLQRGETYSVIVGAVGYHPIYQDGVYVPPDLPSPHEVNVVLYR